MKLFPTICYEFAVMLCYLGNILAIRRFCKEYMKISSIKEKWFLFLFFSGSMAIQIIYVVYPVNYLIYSVVSHMLFAVLLFVLFQAEFEKKIVIFSMLLAMRTLVGDFCSSLLTSILLFCHYVVKGEVRPVIQLWWEECIIFGLSYAAGILVIYWWASHKMSFLDNSSGRGFAALSIPFLLFIVVDDINGLAATRGIFFRSGGDWGIYYDQLFSHAAVCVFAAISMLAAGFYIAGMEAVYQEQKKKERYQAGVMAYQAMEEQYHQMERLRHDLKNHLTGMQGMLKNKEWEKLGKYLERMLETGAIVAGEEATGNKALDALFFYKRKLAEERNIQWESDVQLPGSNCVDSFDLCVLFGNILDNAIEACERMRSNNMCFIKINAKIVKKCFLVEVKNSTDLKKVEEVRHTHKENTEWHGIGIQNVEDMVRRYQGVLEMELKEGVFSVSVLLPLVT